MSGPPGSFKTFTWDIENLSFYILGRNRYLRSPPFTSPSGLELELEFFIGIMENSEFTLSLKNKDTCPGNPLSPVCDANVSILTLNGRNNKLLSHNGTTISGIKGDLLQPQDKITVQCKMRQDVPQNCFARTSFLRENFLWVFQRCDFTNNTRIFQMGSTEFVIHIYDYDSGGKVHAKLEQVQDNGEKFCFPLCRISAMGADGTVWGLLCEEYFFSEPWSFSIAIKEELVVKGMLLLQWEFVIGLVETSDKELPPVYDVKDGALAYRGKTRNYLGSDLYQLYRDHKFCDVVLKVGESSFPAHKSILSARSPVFEAMFATDMEEGRKREVDIKDVDKDTLDRMLIFLYTDTLKVPHPTLGDLHWEEAFNLYYAADKYALLQLKEKCRSVLVAELSSSNVCEALTLADMYQDKQLMQSGSKFIWENHSEVLNSRDWMALEEKQPKLTTKLLHEMCIKRRM